MNISQSGRASKSVEAEKYIAHDLYGNGLLLFFRLFKFFFWVVNVERTQWSSSTSWLMEEEMRLQKKK